MKINNVKKVNIINLLFVLFFLLIIFYYPIKENYISKQEWNQLQPNMNQLFTNAQINVDTNFTNMSPTNIDFINNNFTTSS
jgi:hypothetical protein